MGASFSSNGFGAVFAQFFPPKSKFSVDQIPDLTGRVAIVTGRLGELFHMYVEGVDDLFCRWEHWDRQGDGQGTHASTDSASLFSAFSSDAPTFERCC